MMFKKNCYFIPLFPLILCICIAIYWPGLKGGFIFDDFPNLQDLGTYGAINSWDKAVNFITNGFSGPTGRPISLASFLINDNSWPSVAYSFKYTNLMIHLLNGTLLYWAMYLILLNYNYKEEKVYRIALLASAIWLLHPYFVSTTLYVVQRMAQLATIFTLMGIIGYLKFRLLLHKKKIRSYIGMSLSITIFTILATYSKENGALLPLLILVIEFCNPNAFNKPIWQWRLLFLLFPSFIIITILMKYIDFSENPWPNRNFNQIERLYSEARILSEYLYNIMIPQVELRGLYQDGYKISKSLFHPITTLYSIIFILILIFSALMLKKKYPLYSLAILFFFSAHLMESTVIGLELYFEHRNYLATLFIFMPLCAALHSLNNKIDIHLVSLIFFILLSILCYFTYERSKLWGDTNKLQLYWAANSPDSPRAQNAIAAILFDQGKFRESNAFLESATARLPDSALLNLRLLLQKIQLGLAGHQDFELTLKSLRRQSFDAQAIQVLRVLVEFLVDNNIKVYNEDVIYLLDGLEKDSPYNKFPLFNRLVPYLKAQIYLMQDNANLALDQYSKALHLYQDTEAGMLMVAELGSKHYPKKALILLNQVENVYSKQPLSELRRSKKEYDIEIYRIRLLLNQMLKDNNEN